MTQYIVLMMLQVQSMGGSKAMSLLAYDLLLYMTLHIHRVDDALVQSMGGSKA